jgi:predicted nucleic-acid-binding protein
MIGLDTNVLVRYLAQDDPVQSASATDFIDGRLSEQEPGFVSVVTMAETAWVLRRTYGLSDADVAAVIERTLQSDVLIVQHEQEVFTAMVALKDRRGSFADALIGALGASAGCSVTVTFDRGALRLPEFEPLRRGGSP